jgi:hypothetical protein
MLVMVFSTFFDKICYNIIFTLCRVDLIRSNACILYLGSPHLRQDQCLIIQSLHLEISFFFVSPKKHYFSLDIYMAKWKRIFLCMLRVSEHISQSKTEKYIVW